MTINVPLLIEQIKSKLETQNYLISRETKQRIKRIQTICNEKYWNAPYFGNAALNRKILLDAEISELLTKETLLAIYKLNAYNHTSIRLHRSSFETTIGNAIEYGFREGLDVIRLMPNNDYNYSPEANRLQQECFQRVTLKNILSLQAAALQLGIDTFDPSLQLSNNSSTNSYVDIQHAVIENRDAEPDDAIMLRVDKICKKIAGIKQSKKATIQLLIAPKLTSQIVLNQATMGLQHALRLLNIEFMSNHVSAKIEVYHSYDSFLAKFVINPSVVLAGPVSHFFYDRLHFEACLVSDQEFEFIDGNEKITVTLGKILVDLITMTEGNERAKDIRECNPMNLDIVATESTVMASSITKEQFSIRIKRVERDLDERFNSCLNDDALTAIVQLEEIIKSINPESTDILRSWETIALLKDYAVENQFTNDSRRLKKINAIVDIIQTTIHTYDQFAQNSAEGHKGTLVNPRPIMNKINEHRHVLMSARTIWPYVADLLATLSLVLLPLQTYRFAKDGMIGFFAHRAKTGLIADNAISCLEKAANARIR